LLPSYLAATENIQKSEKHTNKSEENLEAYSKEKGFKMDTIELSSTIEIKRFIEILNELGRAPLSAYWEICKQHGTYIEDLDYPISRSVMGEVRKRAKNLKEKGIINNLYNSHETVRKNLNEIVVRRLIKLGLIRKEKNGNRIFLKPVIGTIFLKVKEEGKYEIIEDIGIIHQLVRNLRGKSKTRQNFEKRLRYEVPRNIEIIFPS
jgi:predicted transcriptional regulator